MNGLAHASSLLRRKQRGIYPQLIEQEVFMGEGFQSSRLNTEARVLVRGNHSGAMTRTLG